MENKLKLEISGSNYANEYIVRTIPLLVFIVLDAFFLFLLRRNSDLKLIICGIALLILTIVFAIRIFRAKDLKQYTLIKDGFYKGPKKTEKNFINFSDIETVRIERQRVKSAASHRTKYIYTYVIVCDQNNNQLAHFGQDTSNLHVLMAALIEQGKVNEIDVDSNLNLDLELGKQRWNELLGTYQTEKIERICNNDVPMPSARIEVRNKKASVNIKKLMIGSISSILCVYALYSAINSFLAESFVPFPILVMMLIMLIPFLILGICMIKESLKDVFAYVYMVLLPNEIKIGKNSFLLDDILNIARNKASGNIEILFGNPFQIEYIKSNAKNLPEIENYLIYHGLITHDDFIKGTEISNMPTIQSLTDFGEKFIIKSPLRDFLFSQNIIPLLLIAGICSFFLWHVQTRQERIAILVFFLWGMLCFIFAYQKIFLHKYEISDGMLKEKSIFRTVNKYKLSEIKYIINETVYEKNNYYNAYKLLNQSGGVIAVIPKEGHHGNMMRDFLERNNVFV